MKYLIILTINTERLNKYILYFCSTSGDSEAGCPFIAVFLHNPTKLQWIDIVNKKFANPTVIVVLLCNDLFTKCEPYK